MLATGGRYAIPDVAGVAELWGNSVIHCPFCHGWEARDARLGLLAVNDEHVAHVVPMLSRLSADLEAFDEIAAVRAEDGVLRTIVLPDGREVERDILFVFAPPAPRDAPFAHRPLERIDAGLQAIDTDVDRPGADAVSQARARARQTECGRGGRASTHANDAPKLHRTMRSDPLRIGGLPESSCCLQHSARAVAKCCFAR